MAKKQKISGGPYIRNSAMIGAQNDLNNYAVRDDAGKKMWAESVKQQQAQANAADRIKAIAQRNQTNSIQSQSQNQSIKP